MRVHSEHPFRIEECFVPFAKEISDPDITIRICQVEQLPSLPDAVIWTDNSYSVYADGSRSFCGYPRDPERYAVSTCDQKTGTVLVQYLERGAHCFSELSKCFFHIGFESLLIHHSRLCFHASCIQTDLGGILFSGPSGIGKSTQADLWCKYRDAKLINGDRPILEKTMIGWSAWGSPYAGSSRCHVNESCSVKAVVMLRQAKECSLCRMGKAEAFRAIWSGLTVYSWDEAFVRKVSELVMELIDSVPVYKFSCTPDAYAVDFLEEELRKDVSL